MLLKRLNLSQDYFNNKLEEIKQTTPVPEYESRGLPHDNVLNELREIRHESYVIGRLMLEQGYRISEALRIVSEPEKHLKSLPNGDYIIREVVGKGGKVYHDKILSHSTYRLISNLENIPSKSAFNRDLKLVNENLRVHDFRYQFARDLYEKKVPEIGDSGALELVSKALNHNRLEISKYYLSEA